MKSNLQISSHLTTEDYYTLYKSFRNQLSLLHEVSYFSHTNLRCYIRTHWTAQKLSKLIHSQFAYIHYFIKDIPIDLLDWFVSEHGLVLSKETIIEISKRIPAHVHDYILFIRGCVHNILVYDLKDIPSSVIPLGLAFITNPTIFKQFLKDGRTNTGILCIVLETCIEHDRLEIVQMLDGRVSFLPFHLLRAIWYRSSNVACFLVPRVDNQLARETAFRSAAHLGDYRVVETLLEYDIPFDYDDGLLLCTCATNLGLFKRYLEHPRCVISSSVALHVFDDDGLLRLVLDHPRFQPRDVDDIVKRAIASSKFWVMKHPSIMSVWKTIY